jgi:restriction endonuclease S subunit
VVESSIHQCGSKGFGADWPSQTPKGWSVKRLKHVVTVSPGKAHLTRLPDTTLVTFVPMESVGTDGQIDRADEKELNMVYNGFTYFADGDVVIAKVTPCFENGKAALLSGLKNGIGFGTTELTTLRPSNAVYPKWLFYLVRSQEVGELGKSWMFGVAGLKRIPDDFFRLLPITLPPLTEQQAIATFLDRETAKIDTLIEKQQRLVTLLTEKRQAVISHAVTKGLDTTIPMKDTKMGWLGRVPAHWDIKRIKYLSNLCTSRATTTEFPVALENIEPLTGRLLETDTTYENDGLYFQPGDLLFGKLRVYQAKVLLADRCGEAVGDLFVLRPTHKVDGKYFQYQLLDSAFIAVADGSTFGAKMPRVSWDFLGNMRLPHPPLIEQKAIAAFLDRETAKIDNLIGKANQSIDLMKERRSALISAAVTGKIDVRQAI